MPKFILVMHGPMCAGKSTVTKLLMQEPDVFRGAYDAFKWLISNYSSGIPRHKDIAKELVFAAISKAAESGLSIVVDGGFDDYEDRYKSLAKKYGHIYLSINIEAPAEVLEKRFFDRVESAKASNSKTISVTTIEGFRERHQWYLDDNKDLEAATFDSSKMTAEEIVLEIKNILSSK